MKIYTEVNYIWKDDKLVQTDSKSFDYEGEVESCHWYHRHSTTVSVPSVTPKMDFSLPKNFSLPTITLPTLPTIPSITLPKGGTLADTTNVLREGLHSGTSAITEGIKKINKDNPNPNLNLQTPDQLWNKGRDMLHDAATNLKKIWDRNRPKGEIPNLSNYIPPTTTDESTDTTLLEDLSPGSRATGAGTRTNVAGSQSNKQRRSINKQNAPSLINQQMQKKLHA